MTRADDAIRLLPAGNTRASLAIDGPASATWNTVVRAAEAYEGPAGGGITLAAVADGTWVANVGTLTLGANPSDAVKSLLDLDTVTGDLDTIVRAQVGGSAGDAITVTVVGDSALAEGVTIDEVGTAVTIHFEDGVSTVADVEAAIGTDSTLIEVDTTGTGATVLDSATDECTAEALAGGSEETVTIGAFTYLFRATVIDAFDVKIGAAATNTIDNLIAAINLNGTAGDTYGTGTTEHTQVRAYAGAGDTMDVHSRPTILDAVGTLIATTDDLVDGGSGWGAATLADGTDGTNVTFVVTGDDVVCHYADGYSTVEDFEAALAADATAAAVMEVETAGTTPLYRLVVTNDDFSATPLTGSGAASSAAPSLTDESVYKKRPFYADEALVMVRNSDVAAGTTNTATVSIWGWNEATGRGHLIGILNGGDAIAEAASDIISYTELLIGIGKFSRFYAQLAGGGAGTEIAVYLDFVRPGAHD